VRCRAVERWCVSNRFGSPGGPGPSFPLTKRLYRLFRKWGVFSAAGYSEKSGSSKTVDRLDRSRVTAPQRDLYFYRLVAGEATAWPGRGRGFGQANGQRSRACDFGGAIAAFG